MSLPADFRLNAALFDLDGTLVRTFIDFPAMRRAMQAHSEAWGTGTLTEAEDDILAIVDCMTTVLGSERGEEARQEAFAILQAMEEEGCAHPERIAGASELLTTLHDLHRIPIGIITRNCRPVAESLLLRMNLPFDILTAREDVREFKPHPAPVWHTCAALGVSPQDSVMVGDLWADIASARAAGVGFTVGIQWAHDPPRRFEKCAPHREVASMEETAGLLLDHLR
ncbi:MAG: HAD family hydrolase [Armatimonadaceae bacterium]